MRGRDWQALRELLTLRAHFQQFFDQALMPPPRAVSTEAAYEPATDIWEDPGRVVIEVELPGARSDDIDVRLEGDVVLIAGSVAPPDDDAATFLRIERPRGRFVRRLRLPCPVQNSPDAVLHGGVLTVVLRKATGARRVAIDRGEGPP